MIIRKDRAHPVRAGFTLIEMMMVIVVIGILAAISIPAVMVGMRRGNDASQSTELTQIGLALEAFKTKFGVYPPSRIRLRENTVYDMSDPFDVMSVEWLRRIWPQIAITVKPLGATATPTVTTRFIWCQDDPDNIETNRANISNTFTGQTYELEGDECLVFFLGGIATLLDPSTGDIGRTSGTPTVVLNGFGQDARVPATVPDGTTASTRQRQPILFPFAANRLFVRSLSAGNFESRLAPVNLWQTEFGSPPTATVKYLEDDAGNYCLPSYRPMVGRSDGPPIAYFSAYEGAGYRPDDLNLLDEQAVLPTGFQVLWPVVTTVASTTNPNSQGDAPNPYTETREDGLIGFGATPPQGTVKPFLPNSFQLIIAGVDGKFGRGGALGGQRDVSNVGGASATYKAFMPKNDPSWDNFSNVTGGGQKIGDFHDGLLAK